PNAVRYLRDLSDRVHLEPLAMSDTEALLRSMFGDAELHAVSDWIQGLSQGNPKQIFELAQFLVSSNVARYAGGAWTLPRTLAELVLPNSRDQALLATLEGLGAEARAVAELLAVVSEEQALGAADLDELMRAPGTSDPTRQRAHAALQELCAANILVESQGRYAFANRSFRE